MTNEEISDVVEMYSDMIRRICFTYMKNEHEADDIYQTVFLKYIQSQVEFENETHRKAWFIRVTVNCCKDTLKSFFRKNVSSIDMCAEEYYEDKDYRWVRDALMQLPKKYRIVLYLFYYEQYSAAEIAEVLGSNENTVYTHLNRGRTLLKNQIGDD